MSPDGFTIARLPRIVFGDGRLDELPATIRAHGSCALLVTGAKSFRSTAHWPRLIEELRRQGVAVESLAVEGEPTPVLVDAAVAKHARSSIDVVVGIGGGSALDAAKAIAGLLKPGNSVLDHLEGVGPELPYRGPATPFIAVPTTAGTGSEATRNAVLSVQGEQGYKKSFRDDRLVAQVALVDPQLLAGCPPAVMAANGMDAFTQLLESFVSLRANAFTDALALSGMTAVRDGFFSCWQGGETDEVKAGRSRMAYAALVSGVTLAQTGLGSVHGLASPLGAFFPVPHGVLCGTLVAEATRVNLRALRERSVDSPALAKYAEAGRLLTNERRLKDQAAQDRLVDVLMQWTGRLQLPHLSAYGVRTEDIGRIVAQSRGSSMKTNPVVLTDDEIAGVVQARL